MFKKRFTAHVVALGLSAALGVCGVSARATEPPADIKATLRAHGAQSIDVAGPDEAPELSAFIDFMKARLKVLFPTLLPLPAIDLIRVDRLNDISNFATACDREGNACALIITKAGSQWPLEKQKAGLGHEMSHVVIEREGVGKLLSTLPPQVIAGFASGLSEHIHAIRDYINRQTPFPDEQTEMYNYVAGSQTEEIASDVIDKLILCDGEVIKTMIDDAVNLQRQIVDATQRYMEDRSLPDSGRERFRRRFDILNMVMHHPGGQDRRRFIDLIGLESAPGCTQPLEPFSD